MCVTDKHGCPPEEVVSVVSHILESCKLLEFVGLMTIGAIDSEPSDAAINPDFQVGLSSHALVLSHFVETRFAETHFTETHFVESWKST